MGSCASVDKSRPGPPMKLMAFGTRADSLVIPESPKKENSPADKTTEDGGVTAKTRWSFSSARKSLESPSKLNSVPVDAPTAAEYRPAKSRWSFSSAKKSFGSKEEMFFDSQAWLESDDEFHSVNGDFTPSRGNTPKSSFSERLPRIHSLLLEEKPPLSPSKAPPIRPRKKLAELFRDSISEEHEGSSEESPENQSMRSAFRTNSNECINGVNTIEGSSVSKKEKIHKYGRRCLPVFTSCSGGFSEKRKKMNPTTVVVK